MTAQHKNLIPVLLLSLIAAGLGGNGNLVGRSLNRAFDQFDRSLDEERGQGQQ